MGRAPCCEKMGLKKGPWSSEEDQVLISYIQQNGHGNWRALPKLAGNYNFFSLFLYFLFAYNYPRTHMKISLLLVNFYVYKAYMFST